MLHSQPSIHDFTTGFLTAHAVPDGVGWEEDGGGGLFGFLWGGGGRRPFSF